MTVRSRWLVRQSESFEIVTFSSSQIPTLPAYCSWHIEPEIATMTASLACFLRDLLKDKNDCGDSSFGEILIVDDNAQLTLEHKIKNTMSFANPSGVCHLNSRWCSQPSLVINMKQSSSHSARSLRRNSCTGSSSCTSSNETIPKNENASWNVLPVVDHSSCPRSKLNAVEPRRLSSELDAPQVPRRSTSPGSLHSLVLEKRKKDRSARNSLHAALGGMAPKSSLAEEKRVCVKKDHAGSQRQGMISENLNATRRIRSCGTLKRA